MTTIIRATLGEIVPEVTRLCGDQVLKTTATAGAASTVTIGNWPIKAVAANDDVFNNRFLYIFKGVSAGDERFVDDYAGATRVVTSATAFTATPTTTSELIITEKRRPLQYEDAVRYAIRRAAYVFNRPLTDTSLRTANILHNGHFEFWDSASNVAAGSFIYTGLGGSIGWAVRGTGAVGSRESTFAANPDPYSLYAGKMVSDGTNEAYFEWVVPDWQRYAGKTFTFKGKAYTTTASRVNFRILDGVNTFATDTGGTSGTHTATAGWEELSRTDFVVATAATKLVVECRISAGGAVTAYFDDVRLTPAVRDYVHIVPPWFEYVSQVFLETGTPGIYDNWPLPKDKYRISYNSSGFMTLTFDGNASGASFNFGDLGSGTGGSGTVDRHIKLLGGGYRTDTLAVTTNVEFAPQLIADMAVMEILAGANEGTEQRLYAAARDRVFSFLGREKFAKLEAGHAV